MLENLNPSIPFIYAESPEKLPIEATESLSAFIMIKGRIPVMQTSHSPLGFAHQKC